MMDENHDEDDLSKSVQRGKGISAKRRTTRNESEKHRRDKLNIYIAELASMVPSCEASPKKLDKTSVLKMTINYMRIHNDLTGSVLGQEHSLHLSCLTSEEIGQLMDESLNGFLFVLSSVGEIVFVSKNITPLLGLEWEQINGSNFMDLVHPDDKGIVTSELDEDDTSVLLKSEPTGSHPILRQPTRHTFEVRMVCNPGNQRIENSVSYENVRIIGYTDTWEANTPTVSKEMTIRGTGIVPQDGSIASINELGKLHYFVAVGCLSRPAPQRFVDFVEPDPAQFDSRHTMDGKFLFVDPRSISMTGYWSYELLGTSLYNYVHHDDMKMLASFHQSLLEFGESKTEAYRMRSKGGQWVWMKSRSFISYNHWNSKPEFFCSKNVAVSEKQELFTPQVKNITHNAPQIQASSRSTSDGIYSQQSELLPSWITDTIPQSSRRTTHGGDKELVHVSSNLSLADVSSSRTMNSSQNMSTISDDQSRGHSLEEESDSTHSVDLSMPYEELESFIEAQRQLHEQLTLKHTILEEAITKQKHQLQSVQQQILLNLQAQLTIDPSKSQEVFEEHFGKAKKFSELHGEQENKQKKLLETLKETGRRVEKRNRKQLKYYHEKRPKLSNTPKNSTFASLFTQGSGEMIKTASNQRSMLVGHEGSQPSYSRVLPPEQFVPATQAENIQIVVQNQGELVPQANAQAHVLPTFTSQLLQPVQLSSQTQRAFQNVENTTGQASSSVTSPIEPQPQITIGTNEPTTLSNIQNLLTASSQNPQRMQKLLSGLRSQPEVAQTLLDLLKQAQASELSEKDSLLFSQSLQNTTDQFSVALNTTITNQPTYQPSFSVQKMQQQQQRQQQQLQQRRNHHHHQVQAQQQQGNKRHQQGKPKQYFSSFSTKKLEAMILTSSPKGHTSKEGSAVSSCGVVKSKLRKEGSSDSPLLIHHQQLLQNHQDQRRLLIRQQEQILLSCQQSRLPQAATATNQDIFAPFAQSICSQQDSSRSLLTNSQPGTSSVDQEAQPSTINRGPSQPSTSWDSESPNFELNDADEVVLNMLLAQSSMDTLFDLNPDSLLEYLNMNPDLTSD